MLTHGFGDDSETWGALTGSLAERWRVWTWDLRGHGRSGHAASYHVDDGMADLARVIDRAASPVVLVGHSLGGYLSLTFALQHPERVSALVLLASGPGYRDADARRRWNEYVDSVAGSLGLPAAAAGLCHQHDSWVIDHLPALRPPLLQIIGERDERFRAGVDYIQRALPGSTLAVIPDAGHHPQRSHPDDVAAAIAELLTSVPEAR